MATLFVRQPIHGVPGGNANHLNTTDVKRLNGLFGRLGVNVRLASIADGTPHMTMVGGVLMAGKDYLALYLRLSGGGNPHASTPPSSNMFLVSKRAESNRFGAPETLILGGE